jgi:hypothetical protein
MNTHKPRLAAPLKIKQVEEPPVIFGTTPRLCHSSMECWIQADMDVSGRMLRPGCRQSHDENFYVLWTSVGS